MLTACGQHTPLHVCLVDLFFLPRGQPSKSLSGLLSQLPGWLNLATSFFPAVLRRGPRRHLRQGRIPPDRIVEHGRDRLVGRLSLFHPSGAPLQQYYHPSGSFGTHCVHTPVCARRRGSVTAIPFRHLDPSLTKLRLLGLQRLCVKPFGLP